MAKKSKSSKKTTTGDEGDGAPAFRTDFNASVLNTSMNTANYFATGSSHSATNRSTHRSGGSTTPPPPPPPSSGNLQDSTAFLPIVEDVAMPISHANYAKAKAAQMKKAVQASQRASVKGSAAANLPSIGAGNNNNNNNKMQAPAPMAMKHRASAVPPPPPPPPSSSASSAAKKKGTVAGIASFAANVNVPPPPPPPAPTATNKRGSTLAGLHNIASHVQVPPPPPPPPSGAPPPPPPPPVVAEGVPVSPEDAAKAKEKAAKKAAKKEAKRLEKEKQENWDDEDLSVSEHDEALSAEEKAEQQEKEVRKTLCWALLSACGVIALIKFIGWLTSKMSNDVDTGGLEDDVNLAAQQTAAGNAAAVNTGMAQQMAVAASQGAAASTAAGTTAAATVAATTAAAAAATVTSTSVTAASLVSVSAVAVTGAGMATGVIPVPAFLANNEHPCHSFLNNKEDRPGGVVLHLQGLPDNFFSTQANTERLEAAFTEAYNQVLGVCGNHIPVDHNDTLLEAVEGENPVPTTHYARWLQNATLDQWDYWTLQDGETGQTVQYFTTEWTAFVGCDDDDANGGCSQDEPLFYEGDFPGASVANGVATVVDENTTSTAARRWLQATSATMDDESNLEDFMMTLQDLLQDMLDDMVEFEALEDAYTANLFYGASINTTVTTSTQLVEEEGQAYQGATLMFGSGANGAMDRPAGLPTCTLPNGSPIPGLELKEGYVQLGLLGLESSVIAQRQQELQELFREAYNTVMGGCQDKYYRVMEKATFREHDVKTEQGAQVTTLYVDGETLCAGCADHEPLFEDNGNAPAVPKTRGKPEQRQRFLKIESDTQLAAVANEFAKQATDLLQRSDPDANSVDAYYAASLDAAGNVVQGAGEESPFANPVEDEEVDGLVDCATNEAPTQDSLITAKFELFIENMIEDMNKTILELVMQDIYNEITGMCDSNVNKQRVAHQMTINNVQHHVIDNNEGGSNSMRYLDLNVTAELTCNNCQQGEEPMFWKASDNLPNGEGSRRRELQDNNQDPLLQRFQAKLTSEINQLLDNFHSTPYYQPGVSLFESSDPNGDYPDVKILYGVTYDARGDVVQSVGIMPHGNIFGSQVDDLTSKGPSVVSTEDCQKHLLAADSSRDHALTDEEYFSFVRALFGSVEGSTGDWPTAMKGYKDLPNKLKQNFRQYQQGGLMPFGKPEQLPDGSGVEFTGEKLIRVEAICYYTGHAIRESVEGETAPAVTSAPTVATVAPTEAEVTEEPTLIPTEPETEVPTTEAPTTAAPTDAPTVGETAAPTASPTTGAPTIEPTSAPTETRIVEVDIQWKFQLDANREHRAATDDELEEFVTKADAWITTNSEEAYAEDDVPYTFDSQSMILDSSDYDDDKSGSAEYNILVETKSEFIFKGDPQPNAQKVFEIVKEKYDLVKFVQDNLWVADGAADAWIFDNVVGEAKIAAGNIRMRMM